MSTATRTTRANHSGEALWLATCCSRITALAPAPTSRRSVFVVIDVGAERLHVRDAPPVLLLCRGRTIICAPPFSPSARRPHVCAHQNVWPPRVGVGGQGQRKASGRPGAKLKLAPASGSWTSVGAKKATLRCTALAGSLCLMLRGGKQAQRGRQGKDVKLVGAGCIPISRPRASYITARERDYCTSCVATLRLMSCGRPASRGTLLP